MKSLLLGGLIAAFAAGAAVAADMPLKAPPVPMYTPTWTGTYVGINGGYGWARSDLTRVGFATTGEYDTNGGLAGVTYGGNWQAGHVVLGFESDLDWAHLDGTVANAGCGVGVTCFTNNKWLSTERMRAGWDFNGWLVYGTLGAAFSRVSSGAVGCPTAASCIEGTRTGWTAGVGIETMFYRNWSFKIEYLHYDLGDRVMFAPVSATTVLDRGDIVRAGINYHFDLLNLLHLN